MDTSNYQPREYLSYSTLMSFARCPRRYFYQKSGIYPHEESNALLYGSAMHKAFPIALTQGIDPAIEAFDSVWDDKFADSKRSKARARVQISNFVNAHRPPRGIYTIEHPPANTIKLAEEVSDWEIPFVLDIGLPIPLVGRIDGWCRHRDTGELWLLEYKTTSSLSSYAFQGLSLNPQFLTYGLVGRTLGVEKIQGVMVEAMLVHPTKADCMTFPIPISDHQLEHMLAWLRFQGQMLLECEKAGEFIKNFSGCSAYPLFYQPGSHCEYEMLCEAPSYEMLTGYYATRKEHRLFDVTNERNPIGATNSSEAIE